MTRLRAALFLGLGLGLGGCPRDRTQPPSTPTTPPHRYAVRAEVVKLASPAAGGAVTVYLRHEPIDDFVDASGQRVGMASMVMPFEVEPAALPRGLAPGEQVQVAFTVDWAGPTFRVERLDRLQPAPPAGKATSSEVPSG